MSPTKKAAAPAKKAAKPAAKAAPAKKAAVPAANKPAAKKLSPLQVRYSSLDAHNKTGLLTWATQHKGWSPERVEELIQGAAPTAAERLALGIHFGAEPSSFTVKA